MAKKLLSALLCGLMALCCLTACDAEQAKKIKELAKNTDISGLESMEKDIVNSVTGAGEIPSKDRSGNEIKVPAEVNTIVSLSPSTTRILIDLGLALKIVAVDTNSMTYKDYLPSGVKTFDMMNPDNEAIAVLKPDIVFTSGISAAGGTSPFKSLTEAGICVADIPSTASVTGIGEDIKFIGNCTGKGLEAAALTAAMDASFALMSKACESIPEDKHKTVLFMLNVPTSDSPAIYTFGSDTYLDEMLTKIGAKNVCASQKGWVTISIEDAVAMNPDVILTTADYVQDPVKDIKALKGWENVKAVKNSEVFKVDSGLAMQPNNHVVDAALEWIKDIYPDIFSDLSKSIEKALKDTVEKIKGIAGVKETTGTTESTGAAA